MPKILNFFAALIWGTSLARRDAWAQDSGGGGELDLSTWDEQVANGLLEQEATENTTMVGAVLFCKLLPLEMWAKTSFPDPMPKKNVLVRDCEEAIRGVFQRSRRFLQKMVGKPPKFKEVLLAAAGPLSPSEQDHNDLMAWHSAETYISNRKFTRHSWRQKSAKLLALLARLPMHGEPEEYPDSNSRRKWKANWLYRARNPEDMLDELEKIALPREFRRVSHLQFPFSWISEKTDAKWPAACREIFHCIQQRYLSKLKSAAAEEARRELEDEDDDDDNDDDDDDDQERTSEIDERSRRRGASIRYVPTAEERAMNMKRFRQATQSNEYDDLLQKVMARKLKDSLFRRLRKRVPSLIAPEVSRFPNNQIEMKLGNDDDDDDDEDEDDRQQRPVDTSVASKECVCQKPELSRQRTGSVRVRNISSNLYSTGQKGAPRSVSLRGPKRAENRKWRHGILYEFKETATGADNSDDGPDDTGGAGTTGISEEPPIELLESRL